MTATAVVATQLKSIFTHHKYYQHIMYQTDVCYDVTCRCLGQYPLWKQRRLYVLVADELMNLTRLLENEVANDIVATAIKYEESVARHGNLSTQEYPSNKQDVIQQSTW